MEIYKTAIHVHTRGDLSYAMMSEYRCVSLRAISSYSSGSLKTSQIEIIRTG